MVIENNNNNNSINIPIIRLMTVFHYQTIRKPIPVLSEYHKKSIRDLWPNVLTIVKTIELYYNITCVIYSTVHYCLILITFTH